MVYRVYAEKKPAFAHEANALLTEARDILGIASLEKVRVINRYDVENIAKDLFEYAKKTVFSEPQLDTVSGNIDTSGAVAFAVEYLPRTIRPTRRFRRPVYPDLSQGERPTVRTAKVYLLYGALSEKEVAAIKKYVHQSGRSARGVV